MGIMMTDYLYGATIRPLYPFTGLMLSPRIAALASSERSVSVISDALRLRSAVIRPD